VEEDKRSPDGEKYEAPAVRELGRTDELTVGDTDSDSVVF
jgi:hypothetical protein